MTDAEAIEPMLRDLIVAHGIDAVQAKIGDLLRPGTRWSDWQTIYDSANNVANSVERKRKKSLARCAHGRILKSQT